MVAQSHCEGPNENANVERIVILGRIGGAFGVAGWVKIESYTDPPGNLLKYPLWLLRVPSESPDTWVSMRPTQGRVVAQGVQAQLDRVTSREQAAGLRGAEIGVRRGELPHLAPGEYYWDDLIGLEACSPDGDRLGEIAEIRATPAHPLLRVIDKSRANGKAYEAWVPLVRERIKDVDLEVRRVVIDWRRDW